MRNSRKRIIVYIVILFIVLIIIGGLFISRISTKAIPDYDENIEISEVTDSIKVYRDSLAIPHLFAKNEKDLYTAVGYTMAQDRLWQMDLLRRGITGQLSEIFGEDLLQTDILMRSLRVQKKSKEVLQNTPPEIIKALEAFSEGVNQYIKNNRDELPPEFSILQYEPKPWKPIHSVNLIGYMAWDLTMPWSYEIALYKLKNKLNTKKYQALIPDIEKQETYVYPNAEEDSILTSIAEHLGKQNQKLASLGLELFTGSNNWAVSGEKTASGKPLLANDMHLGLFSPGIWYQMHHSVQNGLNVKGLVLPGQPFVIVGHNDTIAWGMTNVMLDDMDFYKETIHPDDSGKYRLNGEWEDFDIVTENIPVKGKDTIQRKIRYNHRGPIISEHKDIKNESISMQWIGNEYSNELRSVYRLNHAGSWEDFKDAVRTFSAISQNIVYADINNNIGLYCCAGIPIREGNGIGLYPGDTTQYDWKGFVPFEELPHIYNPQEGIVASANNRTAGEDYPYYISRWFDLPSRINRIRELLENTEKHTVQDFMNIQTDHKSNMAERIKPIILDYLEKTKTDFNESETKGLKLLKNWDAEYAKSSAAPLIFEQFYINFAKELVEQELGDSLTEIFMGKRIMVRNLVDKVLEEESIWIDNENRENILTDKIKSAYQTTIMELSDKSGTNPEKWKWENHHTLTLKHPLSEKKILDKIFKLNRGPFPVGGSYHTVSPYSYSYNKPYEADHGASHRHIFNTADWDESVSVIPTGTSGIPNSEHYCDQTVKYISNQYYPNIITKDSVIARARYKMTFIKKD
ncbi:MAG: penicillin acylase family protein [Bacteroidales bacterium]